MNLENERKEIIYKYDFDYTEEEAAFFKKIAIERFAKDEKAQINYAVLSLLNEAIDNKILENIKGDTKKKNKKGEKNGSKNNSR